MAGGRSVGYPGAAMQRHPELVLASTSRYRKALLERLRVPFEVVAPGWDEVRLDDPDLTVLQNARGKAGVAAMARPRAAILASDQVAYCDGRILEKPLAEEAACEQLAWLSGKEHTLHTCVLLRTPDGIERFETAVARLRVRTLGADAIAAYVRADLPLDCAGSYRSEGFGIVLFDYLQCEDPTAIEGLPLVATRRLLEEAGWRLLPPAAGGS
jgi:septum formation protein